MTFLGSLRIQVKPTPHGKFVVLKDGQVIATCETQQAEEERASAESSRIEGF
jgi:hypothetical protein